MELPSSNGIIVISASVVTTPSLTACLPLLIVETHRIALDESGTPPG